MAPPPKSPESPADRTATPVEISELQAQAEIRQIEQLTHCNDDNLSSLQSSMNKLSAVCVELARKLEKERGKSAKLRRYIAKQNPAQRQASKAAQWDPDNLQWLVQEQSAMLEKLHSDNREQREQIDKLQHNCHLLNTANDKLRKRYIELRKDYKEKAKSEATRLSDELGGDAPSTPETQPRDTAKKSGWLGNMVKGIKDDIAPGKRASTLH